MANEKASQTLPIGKRYKLRSKEREYEIVSALGSGAFGITYLATSEVKIGNIPTTIRFAIKEHFVAASCFRGDDGAKVLTVPNAISDVAKSREDFITEANRLKKLCHKSRSIVNVNETFEANGTAYYVMEYLDGGTLARCSEEDAISLIKQIADALNEIHNEHVLHLDLKPDNIVLKTNGKNEVYPVLIDFGISKHFDSKGRPTSSLIAKGASLGYAPQEQYAGVNEFSPKYDIYALGAVLFYLCTGKNPPDAFKISPNQQQLRRELTGKVSANVEKAILNAMKPSALERTPSIRQFCDDLMGIDFIPMLNLPSSFLEFSYNKGQHAVSVDSNIGWTVYADEDWCKVTKINNDIVISVSKNKENSSRTCNVSVHGAAYPISHIIRIKQEGTGTEVFPKNPTWWNLYRTQAYLIAGIALTLCIFLGIQLKENAWPFNANSNGDEHYVIVETGDSLQWAIDNHHLPMLQKYADMDSIRALYPLSKGLWDQNKDTLNSLIYIRKAISSISPNSPLYPNYMDQLELIKQALDYYNTIEHQAPTLPSTPDERLLILPTEYAIIKRALAISKKYSLEYTPNNEILRYIDDDFRRWVDTGDDSPVRAIKENCYKAALQLKEDKEVRIKLNNLTK